MRRLTFALLLLAGIAVLMRKIVELFGSAEMRARVSGSRRNTTASTAVQIGEVNSIANTSANREC